jgi:hypothetical protein
MRRTQRTSTLLTSRVNNMGLFIADSVGPVLSIGWRFSEDFLLPLPSLSEHPNYEYRTFQNPQHALVPLGRYFLPSQNRTSIRCQGTSAGRVRPCG